MIQNKSITSVMVDKCARTKMEQLKRYICKENQINAFHLYGLHWELVLVQQSRLNSLNCNSQDVGAMAAAQQRKRLVDLTQNEVVAAVRQVANPLLHTIPTCLLLGPEEEEEVGVLELKRNPQKPGWQPRSSCALPARSKSTRQMVESP
uniref:Uncharacterized protein n=1 Tax=Spongospora subterranea TaxID=70186 RepID=A0A0H5RAH2_9EUKA|eukprot:CRZ05444.1 hypothetical protein [Spongospora subterranea]